MEVGDNHIEILVPVQVDSHEACWEHARWKRRNHSHRCVMKPAITTNLGAWGSSSSTRARE